MAFEFKDELDFGRKLVAQHEAWKQALGVLEAAAKAETRVVKAESSVTAAEAKLADLVKRQAEVEAETQARQEKLTSDFVAKLDVAQRDAAYSVAQAEKRRDETEAHLNRLKDQIASIEPQLTDMVAKANASYKETIDILKAQVEFWQNKLASLKSEVADFVNS